MVPVGYLTTLQAVKLVTLVVEHLVKVVHDHRQVFLVFHDLNDVLVCARCLVNQLDDARLQ